MSDSIKKLQELFAKFPTVGQRTAGRFVYYLINQPKETASQVIAAIEELKKSSLKNNSSILISQQNELIAGQSVIEARAAILPQIQLLGAYNFNLNRSQAGIVFLSRQSGLNGGISAGWLLFNGNKNNEESIW